MALDLENEYTNVTPASGSYPFGSFKNAASPTSFDGTPFEKEWANDWYGFFSKILNDAGITPSGVADTVTTSDYFDGMVKLFSKYLVFDDTGSADDYELDAVSGANPEAYVDGDLILFKAATNNTGPSTIEIGGLGAKALVDRGGSALVGGEVLAGEYIVARYDSGGDDFEIVLGPSTTTIRGLVELATSAEAVTGTDVARAVTPAALTARIAAPGDLGTTTPGKINIAAGTEALPGAYFAGDTDTGIYHPGANELGLVTAGNLALYINSAGNITVPFNLASTGGFLAPNGSLATPGIRFSGDLNTGFYWISADKFAAVTAGAEVTHFNADGSQEWGTVSLTGASYGRRVDANHITATTSVTITTLSTHEQFYNPNGLVGSIKTLDSATQYLTSSARELKTVLGGIDNALEIVCGWKPYTGYFKTSPEKITRFFIADEMKESCPNTVAGEGKEMQMSYGGAEIITTMAAAIQQLTKRLEELEAK